VENKPSLSEIFAESPDNPDVQERPSLESIFSEPVAAPANPIGPDATPAQVIRNAAMGRIDRAVAEKYLKSVAIDPSAIDNFGKDASGTDVAMGLAQKPAQGLTFGFSDEALGSILPPNVLEHMRRQADEAAIKHPLTSAGLEIGGNVVGAIAAAQALPTVAGAVTNATAAGVIPSAATTAGLGALSGALYGAGSGEGGVQTRLENAADMGLLGGLLGPVGSAAGRTIGPLTERALKLFGKGAKPAAAAADKVAAKAENAISRSPAPAATAPVATPAVDTSVVNGAVIPLTKGQATQSPKLLSLENMARSGAIDDAAQDSILKSDYKQQDAIQNAVKQAAGGEVSEDALTEAGKGLKQTYKDTKAKVGAAYDNASVIRNVFVNKEPLAQTFVPAVKDIMYKQGFDAENVTPETKKLLNQVTDGSLNQKGITALNLERMEFWRRKVSNRAEQLRGDPEGVMLSRVVSAYDNMMGKLPAEALKAGDETALSAINNARYLRRQQGTLFERDKVVSNIVKNDDLTNEELANMVFTGSARGQNLNSSMGRTVRAMKRAAGDQADDLVANLRMGTFGRIIKNSTINTQRAGTDVSMISPAKLLKQLDGLAANKSFFSEVFDGDQQKVVHGLRADLRKIASEQPGARNYSNTAYTLINALRRLPFGLSGLSGAAAIGLKPLAEKGARHELNKSLASVIGEVQSQLVGKSKVYGAISAGGLGGKGAASAGSNEMKDE
jgi:hypothetical protein